jgi:hypothetical protein
VSFRTHLDPGQYELRIQAQDASGNLAGQEPYSVEFYVSDVVGYTLGNPFPNPSHNSVSFPVQISGNELPTSLTLQIISPDGRRLGDFDLDDVSGLYIGMNYIRLKIDELDGGGLPSGVYFYKLEIRGSGKSKAKTGQIIYIRD